VLRLPIETTGITGNLSTGTHLSGNGVYQAVLVARNGKSS